MQVARRWTGRSEHGAVVIAIDLLGVMLGIGLLVLVVTTTIIVTGMVSTSNNRHRSAAPKPVQLAPSAAKALAQARRRAQVAHAELGVGSAVLSGQIIDVSDSPLPEPDRTVEEAAAMATYFAENDPQRVAEVIREWMRTDSTIEPVVRR